jgi:hypothetical protein
MLKRIVLVAAASCVALGAPLQREFAPEREETRQAGVAP